MHAPAREFADLTQLAGFAEEVRTLQSGGRTVSMICPSCLVKQPAGVIACPTDGTALVPEETFAAVDKDLVPGDVVGEYRIEGKIGEGGFGAVYRAVHPVIGKHAAVKVLGRQFSANAAMVSRFIAEARAVNQIRHRNIIDIFAFGALPDGRQYYIMELLDGTPFDRYLDEQRRLSPAQALPILRGIARALDAAHAKGILHRDLKPENVYLVFDEDGRVEPKLLDFGLVKLMGDPAGSHRTKTGTPMGTPYYMSPEQCRGLEVDRRTDVYAFGAMIFQVLTGEVPFTGSSSMDVLVKHMTEEPPAASVRCLDVPPQVDPVIQKMMAKEPADRPNSLGECIDLLVQAAQLGGSALESVKLPPPGARPAGDRAHRSLETVPTVIDDGLSSQSGPAHVRVASGQSLLGSESDVTAAPVAKPGRILPLVAAGVLATVAGVAIVISMKNAPNAPTAAATTGMVQAPPAAPAPNADRPSAAMAATTTEPAKTDDVQVRVDGAPAGATVTADGKELGAAPGPFAMKKGVETKLVVAAKGYKSKELSVTPAPDLVVSVSLDRQATGAAPLVKPASVKGGGKGIHSDLEGFDSK